MVERDPDGRITDPKFQEPSLDMSKIIFLDLDGVLANFVDASFKVHGKEKTKPVDTWDYYQEWGMTAAEFFRPMSFNYWESLDKLPLADWLVDVVYGYTTCRVGVLTSPCTTPGCVEGKRAWIEKHYPRLASRIVFTGNKGLLSHPDALLIDDSDKNCSDFRLGRGWTYLWPQPWNRNSDLAAHGNELLKERFLSYLGAFLLCSS